MGARCTSTSNRTPVFDVYERMQLVNIRRSGPGRAIEAAALALADIVNPRVTGL